jgi:hypothetical protein
MIETLIRIGLPKSGVIHCGVNFSPIEIFGYVARIISSVFVTIEVIPHFFRFYTVAAPKGEHPGAKKMSTAPIAAFKGSQFSAASPSGSSRLHPKINFSVSRLPEPLSAAGTIFVHSHAGPPFKRIFGTHQTPGVKTPGVLIA